MTLRILAIDIGGTSIKSGCVEPSGHVTDPCIELLSLSLDANADQIASAFTVPIMRHAGCFSHVAICMPGPIHYPTGISQMVHKFPSLYGKNIGTLLRESCHALRDMPIQFCHDTCAFLAGEHWQGAVRGCQCCLGVTLGTGIGVAAMVDGQVLVSESGCPIEQLSIWNRPFREGRVEQYVSAAAIVEHYRSTSSNASAGVSVKNISDMARQGDRYAITAMQQYGRDLGMVLCDPIRQIAPQAVVFGGQIAKALDLFQVVMLEQLDAANISVKVYVSQLGEKASLIGDAKLAINKMPSSYDLYD